MAGVELQRQYVAALYPGPKWKKKVSKMADSQVLAIYFREKRKEAEAKGPKQRSDPKYQEFTDDIPF